MDPRTSYVFQKYFEQCKKMMDAEWSDSMLGERTIVSFLSIAILGSCGTAEQSPRVARAPISLPPRTASNIFCYY